MRAQVNLQDFELRTNDVLVVQNGTIGEYRGMSDDARIAVIAFTPEYFQTALQIEATMSLQRRLYASASLAFAVRGDGRVDGDLPIDEGEDC